MNDAIKHINVFASATDTLITVFGKDADSLRKYVEELHNAVVA